jgi:sec-independent protein translocase protein TatA
MFGLRLPELLLILLVVVVLFGARKLPQLGDSLGKGIRAFRKATERGFDKDDSPDEATPQGQLPRDSGMNAPPAAGAEKTERRA